MEFYLKLTLAVHKVTELFPAEGQELKSQILEAANKVLANLLCGKNNSRRATESLMQFFDLAEVKNWVDRRNFEVLRREYGKIEKPAPIIAGRKEKLLKALASNDKTRLRDLVKVFPDINRRTLLRDLEEFTKTGLIVRNGGGRGIHYVANTANVTKNATLQENCDII